MVLFSTLVVGRSDSELGLLRTLRVGDPSSGIPACREGLLGGTVVVGAVRRRLVVMGGQSHGRVILGSSMQA